MKNITKRKDGRFMAHLQINGNRVYAYGRTQKQAIDKLKKLRKKALNYEKQSVNYSVSEWADIWFKTYKEKQSKQATIEIILLRLKNIKDNLGKYQLKAVTPYILQNFFNSLPTSRKKEQIILYTNALFQKAVDINILTFNPCKATIKERKKKKVKTPYTIDEQEKIILASKNTDIECYIYYYLLTGARKNELDNNIEANLDIQNYKLRILNEKRSLSEIEYRYINLSPDFVKYLLENKSKFIFSTSTIYSKFKQLLKTLNINGDIHKLRHTFATIYYYLGVPDKVISAWLGHRQLEVTRDIYIGIEEKNPKERLLKLYNNLLYKF